MIKERTLLLMGDDPTPALLSRDAAVAVDTETTGLDWGHAMLGVSLAWRNNGDIRSCYLLDPEGTRSLPMFGVDGSVPASFVAENLGKVKTAVFLNHSFDYRVLLKSIRMPPLPNLLELMHVARVMAPQASLSLLNLYGKYVGQVDKGHADMKGQRANLGSLDPVVVAQYARDDVTKTFELYEAMRTHRSIGTYLPFHEHDQRFMALVMRLVERGMPIDRDWCRERMSIFRIRMIEISLELSHHGIANPGSPQDVIGWIKSQHIPLQSSAEDVIAPYAKDYPVLAQVLEYRSLSKAIGSWLEPFYRDSEWDGSLHSRLNPFGTDTYRMSSQDPNAQGVPMEKRGERAFGSMFGIFKGPDGMELWGLDLKQAEVRLAAVLSQDQDLQQIIAGGADPYKQLALRIWGDASHRQRAKSGFLSSLYEIGAKTFSIYCGIPIDEAGRILREIRSTFPAAMATSKRMTREMQSKGYAPLVTGRPRWLAPDEADRAYIAFNQHVQGTLAEVMGEAMLRIEQELPDRLRLQVHDNVVLLVEPDPRKRQEVLGKAADLIQGAVVDTLGPKYRSGTIIGFPVDPKPYQYVTQEA